MSEDGDFRSDFCFVQFEIFLERIHWRLLTILKASQKLYVFCYVKKYLYSENLFNTLHIDWDKTQMLKKFLLGKINGTKNAELQLISFNFNLWFLYELKHKVCLSKTVCEISHFRFPFSVSFLLKFIFLFKKMHGLFDFWTS